MHSQIKLGRLEHIPAHGAGRKAVDAGDVGRQCGIRISVTYNLKCPVLLHLLDHCIRHQNFNVRDKRFIFEGWNRDRVHVAKVIRFYGADVIPETTS